MIDYCEFSGNKNEWMCISNQTKLKYEMMHTFLLLFLCSLHAYREHLYDLSEYWASTGLTGDEIGQRYLRGAEDYLVKDYVQRLDHYEDVRTLGRKGNYIIRF